MRLFAAVVTALSLFALSSCTTPTSDELVVGTSGAPASLDFTTTSGAAIPQALMGNIYETLVRIDDNGELQPWLATSWEASPTSYIFHLRENVVFSNGQPFNAHTAKFSLDNVANWTNGLKSGMAPVAATTVVDTHTLKVDLHAPSQNWLWNMGTFVGAMMLPGADPNHPIGTGPYTLAEWKEGQYLSYAANPRYWGTPPAQKHAKIQYFPDAVSSTNALAAGDIQVVWYMNSPELLDRLKKFAVHVGTTNGELLLSMNNKAAPFNDPAVRQAVFHAIDRKGIRDAAFAGTGTDTGGTPIPPTDPWFDPSLGPEFDPERAREILQAAGYQTDGSDPRLKVVITAPSLPYAQSTSEIVFSQLREVGFQMELRTAEFPAVWLAQVLKSKNYQMSMISHVEARDIPHIFGNPNYYIGYDSPRVQELLKAADTAATSEESTELMKAAVRQIMLDAPALTIMNISNLVVADPRVQGINPNIVTDSLPLAGISLGAAGAAGNEPRS
ncbi:ABC transporter substrate-binding protein [Corynebacterium caspium]|uniref:ABC transporter substrate-binding protein n=1 Tax=Corynebacterium caspium TaxID=234828 RepID=UPI00037B208F|nr:ABC transporter substrate-binding protein [Corynebacterium caspium]WKD58875.1 Nickel-binding periplasmic protein precursor [Corynebacterium caspium DSM 44850]